MATDTVPLIHRAVRADTVIVPNHFGAQSQTVRHNQSRRKPSGERVLWDRWSFFACCPFLHGVLGSDQQTHVFWQRCLSAPSSTDLSASSHSRFCCSVAGERARSVPILNPPSTAH